MAPTVSAIWPVCLGRENLHWKKHFFIEICHEEEFVLFFKFYKLDFKEAACLRVAWNDRSGAWPSRILLSRTDERNSLNEFFVSSFYGEISLVVRRPDQRRWDADLRCWTAVCRPRSHPEHDWGVKLPGEAQCGSCWESAELQLPINSNMTTNIWTCNNEMNFTVYVSWLSTQLSFRVHEDWRQGVLKTSVFAGVTWDAKSIRLC